VEIKNEKEEAAVQLTCRECLRAMSGVVRLVFTDEKEFRKGIESQGFYVKLQITLNFSRTLYLG